MSDSINVIEIEPITTIQAYSRFMVKELVNYVTTSFVLCTQWDAFVLNHKAWEEEFLSYDYIGAPWWFNDKSNVGNGGFSLRSKNFLKASSELNIRNFHPEDLVVCRTYRNLMAKSGIKFAPDETASRFSIEGNARYGNKWNGQFGFHDFEMTDISAWTPPAELHKIYRYCDQRKETHLNGVTKAQCMENFKKILGTDNLTIIADSCQDVANLRGITPYLIETKLGNAGSLKRALQLAMSFPPEDIVYLVEDDFIHLPDAEKYIREGLEKAHYVSLYDHADKYTPGPNPFVTPLGEKTTVFLTESSHWKLTNSTVQTFDCRVSTLIEDKDILFEHNFKGPVPDSFKTFLELGKNGRLVATPIPGRATHCHHPWESPLIDWNKHV